MSENADSEGDLIDLGSPVLPRIPPFPSQTPEEISDNLLDSELPVLEQKLQTSAKSNVTEIRRHSIDVEDILITIDDDSEYPLSRLNSVRRSNSEALIHHPKNHLDKSWSCDNLEALTILKNLDEILNASLLESDQILNDHDSVTDEQTQETIEACLLDLDNYLQAFDSNSSNCVEDRSSVRSSASSLHSDSTDDADLRNRLRLMEENYARFLAAGCVNRAYVDTETNERTQRRPLSACDGRSEALERNHPTRATVAVVKRERPGNTSAPPSPHRTSGAGDSDDDIDWSWLQEAARGVNSERRAHAAGDCCTGTVVVEPLQRATSSSEVPKPSTTWLRSSMRRLRHFRLPSNGENAPMETPRVEPVPEVVRPVSAPSRLLPREASAVSQQPAGRASSASRSLSSSVSSLASTVDTSHSCTPAPTPTHNQQEANSTRRSCERRRASDMPESESPLGQWPHSLSSMMACLGCTLGLFNISRFAILTVHFGANFIFQFVILSLVFGLPLFTLQLCLGQQLGAGVIDMWRISPLFQGVGVALLISQALLGLYSIIGVSWMFVFFRDSFITKMDKYRWAEPYMFYRPDVQPPINGSYKLTETIPDYFSGIVLQRHYLATGSSYGTIKFQLAFNLAVVWMIVFVSLSKGLRSYGKVIYVFTLLPVFGTFVLCAKILGLMPTDYDSFTFPEASWNEFFLNPKSWLAAAQETFLTWGMLGAAVMQIASHNKHKHLLQRDSSLVAVITLTVLILMGFLANKSVEILRTFGYNYLPDSFENINSYTFLESTRGRVPPKYSNTPIKYMVHNSFFLGEKVIRPGVDSSVESGYQALRLATELVPATFAVLGAEKMSPFWAVLFYFILILFGIAQQLAIWHCVITGIMAIKAQVLKSWETTITLFSCICGYILGLPMATEFGIYVVFFMDYTVGGLWWLIVIILLQIIAVFMVRGRPYSGDTVVTALFTPNNHPCILSWAPALLSFTWNVILPVALMVLCISTVRNGNFRDIFVWHHAPVPEYWPLWARQFGSMLQLVPILLVPLVAVIQSYRYLSNGPTDILERIQLLYRPPIGEHMTDLAVHEAVIANNNANNSSPNTLGVTEDPPPKYTPPPSYTTATGARLAKFLRQSIRRSVRRLANVLGESSTARLRSNLPQTQPPPPDYNAVLVEMSQTNSTDVSISVPDASTRISTLERLRNIQPTPGSPTLTAAEVASILRSSFRRSNIRRNNNFPDDSVASLSAENLVDSAAPIGETSLVLDHLPQDTVKRESNSSVI
ncbi:sodium-dependent transporter bedraggled isoform X2 [Tribolium madens]|uniref:sodium-dependent transporter bedraggled isoform X2 n=1 Tax=Tribolium madens TaxID=41895 RepID=UPI001CF75197|nr:sodium-dependent transporter bedraggled isoform X2 [Tribolium madens]